jgi:arylsulfatase A-like enzyme
MMSNHNINQFSKGIRLNVINPLILATMSLSFNNPGTVNKIPVKPNIIWIVAEDMSDHWSCYGEKTITTPNIDKLAKEGVLFENVFVSAPVCSPSRSALIIGMYQTSIGAHNHRSQVREGNGGGNTDFFDSFILPDEVPYLPKLFKEAGYYTVLGIQQTIINQDETVNQLGKTDYNFIWNQEEYDDNDWKDRKPGQPFFAQIQLRGGKFRRPPIENPVDPAHVSLPPYYPDDEVLREDWATYLNSVMYLDQEVKKIVERLEAEGLAENSAIFLFTDHGISHLRAKQFLYEDGIKVPLIVSWPDWLPSGERRSELVSHIDIAATSLFLAGIPVPSVMQGQPFFGKDYVPREYIYAARDRCDETMDMIRAIRTQNYKYIHNFLPDRPHTQPNRYKDNKPFIIHMRQLLAEGKLKKETAVYFQPNRPVEELYDLVNDPWEMNNLATDPKYSDLLAEMKTKLWQTSVQIGDLGYLPEPLLEESGKRYGNKYYVLKADENKGLQESCYDMLLKCAGKDIKGMLKGLSHEFPEVRFWAAYGLGNVEGHDEATLISLDRAMGDEFDAVRIAAARAMCLAGKTETALQILTDNLTNSNLIIGMYTALFIEDLPLPLIKKALPDLKNAMDNPYAFTQRIATRLVKKSQ